MVEDKVEKKQEEDEKNKILQYRNKLIKEFKKLYPGVVIEATSGSYFSKYGKQGKQYYQYFLKLIFTNGSWIKIQYHENDWSISEKFDSKYIKPETKEDWLNYLAK